MPSKPTQRRDEVKLPRVAPRLLRWYTAHKRDLPWRRRERDAYAQLVAEIMLQQTQVATVIPYYERFLEWFPTPAALAATPIDEVLALWAGLGYYRRARNLHAAARKIVSQHGGQVPSTVEGLIGLPGVGRYTAGAIASIAFGVRAPVLDGNVARVLMRLVGLNADPKASTTRARLWSLVESLLPVRRCGDFNQALMELGATVCSPQTPSCLVCPLNTTCRARLDGSTARIPRPSKRATVLPAAMVVAAVRRGPELLFSQRPATGLWAGLWELPSEPVQPGESLDDARGRLRRRLPAGTRLSSEAAGTVVRRLTHREVTFYIYAGRACGQGSQGTGFQPASFDACSRRAGDGPEAGARKGWRGALYRGGPEGPDGPADQKLRWLPPAGTKGLGARGKRGPAARGTAFPVAPNGIGSEPVPFCPGQLGISRACQAILQWVHDRSCAGRTADIEG